jgi:hypothetical protein
MYLKMKRKVPIENPRVGGSIPPLGTIKFNDLAVAVVAGVASTLFRGMPVFSAS